MCASQSLGALSIPTSKFEPIDPSRDVAVYVWHLIQAGENDGQCNLNVTKSSSLRLSEVELR